MQFGAFARSGSRVFEDIEGDFEYAIPEFNIRKSNPLDALSFGVTPFRKGLEGYLLAEDVFKGKSKIG